ncbi:MAG TPA: hypothetical protein HA256_00375, partial [Methanoregulaceae archaeon]|nr:hypothetical protein [Methanoregulaceae archaeon]
MMFRKLFIFFILLVLTVGIASAAIPVQPHEFYGAVTINGAPAPAGTTIVAKMWGMPQGQFVTTSPGVYGGPGTFDQRLIINVDADEYESCCVSCGCSLQIEFFVNGVKAQVRDVNAGTGWTTSYLFQPAASTRLNLNTGSVLPTPTATPTA